MAVVIAAAMVTLLIAWVWAIVEAARTPKTQWRASGHARWATIYLLLFIPPVETVYYWAVLRRYLRRAGAWVVDNDPSVGKDATP